MQINAGGHIFNLTFQEKNFLKSSICLASIASMLRLVLLFIMALTAANCASTSPLPISSEQSAAKVAAHEDPAFEPTPESTPKYPGISIAEVFPILNSSSLLDDNGREAEQMVEIEGFILKIEGYKPISLGKHESPLFKFKKYREREGYWAFSTGISRLRGPNTKEIYTETAGPGAVCCTNYSIIDISSTHPRTIFHSEDFGYFRDTMEIFDGDADGIYELMQWDSCMRYFRDDCGACSPEPRAYFKYNAKIGRYQPASKIMQGFVRDQFARTEEWLAAKLNEFKQSKDAGIGQELRRSVVAHVADLLHIGEEQKAWSIFRQYGAVVDNEDRSEIKKRLADCKFYRALPR
ncbi:MAG: hypothetical protein ACKVQW_16110 [Pyrinomonadaceae bacterium]